jgi:hypothetical protein
MNRKVSVIIVSLLLLLSCSKTEPDMFGSVSGIVTDARSGEPVRGVGVTLNPGGIKTTTGSDGRYEYLEIDPGQYTVQAMKDGYQTASLSVVVQAGIARTADIRLNEGTGVLAMDKLTLELGASANLTTFTVSNKGSGDLTWQAIFDCDWIESISPDKGTIKAGESASVSVKIDRGKLTENKVYTSTFVVTSSGGSAEVTIFATGDVAQAMLRVDKTSIDFDPDATMGTLSIGNPGQKELTWQIAKDGDWISDVSPSSGVTAINGQTSVTVKIDRTLLEANRKYTGKLIVTSDGGNAEILLSASKKGGETSTITDGLIACYTFDDGTAKNTVADALHGAFANAPDLIADTPGGRGKAVSLNASKRQLLDIPGNPFANRPEYAISFWMKDFRDGLIFSAIGEYVNRDLNFPQLVCSGGQFEYYSYEGWMSDMQVFGYAASGLQDGKWHLLSFTCVNERLNGENYWTVKLYVDGKLAETSIGAYYASSDSRPSRIQFGCYGMTHWLYGDVYATSMKLDNIRFYDRALNANEIRAIYDAERQ